MSKPMYVRFEVPEDIAEKTYQVVEMARDSGRVRKGTNEVTKLVERGEAKFVVMAADVTPEEILVHIPLLCEEKGIPYSYVPAKKQLGTASGMKKDTASIAVIDAGKGKDLLSSIVEELKKAKGA